MLEGLKVQRNLEQKRVQGILQRWKEEQIKMKGLERSVEKHKEVAQVAKAKMTLLDHFQLQINTQASTIKDFEEDNKILHEKIADYQHTIEKVSSLLLFFIFSIELVTHISFR
jgi:hypothetical protein